MLEYVCDNEENLYYDDDYDDDVRWTWWVLKCSTFADDGDERDGQHAHE